MKAKQKNSKKLSDSEQVRDSFTFIKFDWGTNWYKCKFCDKGFTAGDPTSYMESCRNHLKHMHNWK